MSGAVGVPDLLATVRLGQAHRDLRLQLADAQTELVTGKAADPIARASGDPARLLALDNAIGRIDSRLPLLEMAKTRSGAMQTALEGAQEALGDYGVKMLGFVTTGDAGSAKALARDAEAILGQVLSGLNTEVSGRHVFGGDEGRGAAVAGVDRLMRHVRSAYAGALSTDAADPTRRLKAIVSDGGAPPAFSTEDADWKTQLAHYFDRAFDGTAPPDIAAAVDATGVGALEARAAFRYTATTADTAPDYAEYDAAYAPDETTYLGGDGDAPPVELAEDAALSYTIRADDPTLRDLVMNLSVAVAASDADLSDATARAKMMEALGAAAEGLIAANDGVTDLRAALGLDQSRVDNAIARNTAEKSAFEIARKDLVGLDPYEAATRVTELEQQLQYVYAMTARASALSLVNYLR